MWITLSRPQFFGRWAALVVCALATAARAEDTSSTVIWLGGRLGAEVPLGTLTGGPVWPRMLGTGASLEADVGWRLDRCNVLYALGGFTAYGAGSGLAPFDFDTGNGTMAAVFAPTSGGSAWSAGAGLQATLGRRRLRFVGDLAVAYRRLTVRWEEGSALRLEAFFDLRLAAGADLRISDAFSVSLLGSVTLPTLRADGTLLLSDGTGQPAPPMSQMPYLLGVTLGAHFDLPPGRDCGPCFLRAQEP